LTAIPRRIRVAFVSDRPELIAVWGVSGAGKSTYCRWLRDEGGYEFVENDEALEKSGLKSEVDLAWIAVQQGQIPPAAFVVMRRGHPTVVEVGFRPGEREFGILRELIDAGASAWWFDGDRDGALANWLRRPKPIDEVLWRVQTGYVDRHWTHIAELFRSRIVRTVGPRGTTIPPEQIDLLMFGPESDPGS
jgi:hypothetical protein